MSTKVHTSAAKIPAAEQGQAQNHARAHDSAREPARQRKPGNPTAAIDTVLAIQRAVGNRVVAKAISGGTVPAAQMRGGSEISELVMRAPQKRGGKGPIPPAAPTRPTPSRPPKGSKAQLEQVAHGLELRMEQLESHSGANEMYDKLNSILTQLDENRLREASIGIAELEQAMDAAGAHKSDEGQTQVYGGPDEVPGMRETKYAKPEEKAPINLLDSTAPSEDDATGQALLAYVSRAVKKFDSTGALTEKEMEAVRSAKPEDQKNMYLMYRGTAIDRLAKEMVMEEETLPYVIVTVNREYGADFYDTNSEQAYWYDITTLGQWKKHEVKYGPDVPGRAKIPGARLPSEPESY